MLLTVDVRALFFLQDFIEPTCAIMARAYVHPPAEFQDAPESEGNDVYLCEYEYNDACKVFRKRRYGESGPDDISGANASCPMTPAGEAQCHAGGQLCFSCVRCSFQALACSQPRHQLHRRTNSGPDLAAQYLCCILFFACNLPNLSCFFLTRVVQGCG